MPWSFVAFDTYSGGLSQIPVDMHFNQAALAGEIWIVLLEGFFTGAGGHPTPSYPPMVNAQFSATAGPNPLTPVDGSPTFALNLSAGNYGPGPLGGPNYADLSGSACPPPVSPNEPTSNVTGATTLYVWLPLGTWFFTDWNLQANIWKWTPPSGGGGGGGGGGGTPPPPIVSGGPGNGFMATQVDSPNLDCSVQQRQVLYGISGLGPYASAPIVSADRRTGLQGDGSTGGVVSFLVAPPLAGNLSTVIVSGCEDDSFNGVYDQPTSAGWGADGVNILVQFKQDGPDSSSFGGTLQSTLPAVRVVRQEEGRYDDNGSGIDSQYQPAFASGGRLEVMRWGGYRVQFAKGQGQAILTPVSEDPEAPAKSITLDLDPNKPKAFERGVRLEDGKYLALLVTNGKKPGSHFALQQMTLYGNPYLPGERR